MDRDTVVALRLGEGGGTLARCRETQDEPAWRALLRRDLDPTGRIEAIDALAAWPTSPTAMACSPVLVPNDPVHAVRAP